MLLPLRQSTASQEVLLGPFLDDTDGKTAETGLTIANTDIKIWVEGATSEVNKNSGGATHISAGRYYAVLDATDTATLGKLEINVHVSGALPVKLRCIVLPAMIYDSLILGSDRLDTNVTHIADTSQTARDIGASVLLSNGTGTGQVKIASGYLAMTWADIAAPTTTVNLSGTTIKTATDVETDTQDIQGRLPAALGVGGNIKADVLALSGDTGAADNAEAFFDGTGYAGTNNVIPLVTVTTTATNLTNAATNGDLTATMKASVNTEADVALSDYDPPTRTEATADKNEILAGMGRIATGTIGSTGNSTTALHLTGLTFGDDELNNLLIVIYDVSASEYHARWIEDWADTGELATVATLPFTPQNATDTYVILPIRADVTGGSGLDAAGVRAAIGLASANLDTQLGDLPTNAELATSQAAADDATLAAIAALNNLSAAQVNAEVDTALSDYGALKPTTAGRTLDVSAGGEAGVDWANVGGQGTSVNLSATTTNLVNTVTTYTGNTPQTGDSYGIVNSGTHGNAAIKGYVDDIGVAGAGLTAIPDSAGVTTLLSRIPSALFSGITSLAQWLGLIAGKQTGNSTARTEIRATGAGSGTFDETTDSQEALRDRGDSAWTTPTGFSTHSAADVWAVGTRTLTTLDEDSTTLDLDATIRAALGMASANLDTQLSDLPTVAEFEARTLVAAAYGTAANQSTIAGYLDTEVAAILAAVDTEVAAIKAKTDNLPASPAATGDIPTVTQIWTTALTEAYRSTGSTGTATQLLYEILQNLTEFSIASTTKTVKKLDGSTTAKTYTLDSATAPTSITEAT